MNLPATSQTIFDLIEEYENKLGNVSIAIDNLNHSITQMEMAGVVYGTYVEPVVRQRPYINERDVKKNLLRSAWKTAYNRIQIDRIASAKMKKEFEMAFSNPPEFTFENVKATFGPYLANPRHVVLKGLAEVFCSLDESYKSHSKVKIGVSKLPKRIIINYFSGYRSHGSDCLRDIVNALAIYRGQPLMEYDEIRHVEEVIRKGNIAYLDGREIKECISGKETVKTFPDRGIWVKGYMNGNAHVYFNKETLLDINRALSEFYGEVLPDVEDDNPKRKQSTSVSKDLQFYWTPRDVILRALDFAGIYSGDQYSSYTERPRYEVLEPSCGDGRILDVIKEYGHTGFGIEYDRGRYEQCLDKGHDVFMANFLECSPDTKKFKFVVMNPPFYGKHYVKHVEHALKFLSDKGTLVAILPATARYDHGILSGEWRDLPVGSFSESGTNVPTVMLKIRKK